MSNSEVLRQLLGNIFPKTDFLCTSLLIGPWPFCPFDNLTHIISRLQKLSSQRLAHQTNRPANFLTVWQGFTLMMNPPYKLIHIYMFHSIGDFRTYTNILACYIYRHSERVAPVTRLSPMKAGNIQCVISAGIEPLTFWLTRKRCTLCYTYLVAYEYAANHRLQRLACPKLLSLCMTWIHVRHALATVPVHVMDPC